jgi:hypothetical protein
MHIENGWASEYARRKFGISVDETDAFRLVREAGLDPAVVTPQLTEDQMFNLLSLEAEYRTLRSLWTYLASQNPDGQAREQQDPAAWARAKQLQDNRVQMLAQIYEAYSAPSQVPQEPVPAGTGG